MTPILVTLLAVLGGGLVLSSFVELLYLESLQLRARELPALEYFKDVLAERIGLETGAGALAFSVLRNTLLVLGGMVCLLLALGGETPAIGTAFEAAATAFVLMLVTAYFAPQFLYRKTGAKWLTPLAPLLRLAGLAVRPLTALFSFLLALASLGDREDGEDNNGGSPEESLDALIEAGTDEGIIEEDDRELIHSVVALGDKTVREVMMPRRRVVAIPETASIEDFRTLALENHFSRFPVLRDSIDDIAGIVHLRDILKLDERERAERNVTEFVWPTLFVPEMKPIAELFREMQAENVHMAIVVDEYGETAGIATMEDVFEEVFGEIRDEYDPKADIQEESDGVYAMDGNVDLDRLYELVKFRPDEETESTTVGGLASEWMGHLPEAGEIVERDGIRIEVTKADDRRVESVRVSRAANGEGGRCLRED